MTDLVPPSASTPPRTPWYRTLPTAIIVGAVVLVLVLVAVLLRATPRDVEREAAVELGGRDRAVLVVASGADSITVTGDDIGGDLAVATTPDGSRARPVVDVADDRVTVSTTDVDRGGNLWDGGDTGDGPEGPVDVTVRLSERVRWDVLVAGGAKRLNLDLGGTQVVRIEVRGGQGSIDATLPPPVGTMPVEIAGGAGSVTLDVPADVPARVVLQNGAGSAALDADRRQGVGNGTVLTTPDWPAAGPDDEKVDVVASSGLGSITVGRS